MNNIDNSKVKNVEYPSLESQPTNKNTQIVVWNGKNCSVLDAIQQDNPHRIILTEVGQKLLSLTDPRETTFIYFPIAIKEEKSRLLQLPVEIQAGIHSFLDYKSILALRQTSHDNFTLINNYSLFRNKDCNENAKKYMRNTLEISQQDLDKMGTTGDMRNTLEILQQDLDKMGTTGDLKKISENALKIFLFLFPNIKEITLHDPIQTIDEGPITSPIKTCSFLSIGVDRIIFDDKENQEFYSDDIILPLNFFSSASELRIIGLRLLTTQASSSTIKELPNLKIIDLSEVQMLKCDDSEEDEIEDYSDTFFYSLVSNSPNVETLKLDGTEDTDWENASNRSPITVLYDNFPRCQFLKNLHLQKTKVNDGHLLKIANGCPSLEYIDLRECPEITTTGIEDFRYYFGILYPDQKPVTIDK